MISLRLSALPVALMIATILLLINVSHILPAEVWLKSISIDTPYAVELILLQYSFLPRTVLAMMTGAGLGLAGLLFQQVLRNPLAEPSTLGIANGAQLGMTVVTLWSSHVISPGTGALLGAMFMGALVAFMTRGKQLSPVGLILIGLVLTLYCSAVSQLIGLYYHERLQSVLLWGTGTLTQTDWEVALRLLPQLLIAFIIILALLRPLTLLGLDEMMSRNLGLQHQLMRPLALLVGIYLTASLVTSAGIIGFIGLFAPLITRLLGVRRLSALIFTVPLTGALLLLISDQTVILLASYWKEIPTGTVTAVVGAPALILLLPRLKDRMYSTARESVSHLAPERDLIKWLLSGFFLLVLLALLASGLGKDAHGWAWATESVLSFRFPRVMGAFSAGVMLALAGCIIQRLTGNPVASPEVMGVSTGAAAGLVLGMLLFPENLSAWYFPAACLGSVVTLILVTTVAGLKDFSPQRMMLTGMALNAAFLALLMLMISGGDPRTSMLLSWFAGSTYGLTIQKAMTVFLAALVLILCIPLVQRWLVVLPFGGGIARSLGVPLSLSRLLLMLLAASLTALSTFVVGPLSFVGLMAPHIARYLGFRRVTGQLIVAGLVGASLMMLSDWVGRIAVFPWQLPAGLIAALVGVPFFLWLIRRN
ncbi:Fe(3+)-hydroxamate ABC transporter permease FhuB [Cronobacter sakazakii]|nr:Fe(3+)-hydroxamate ABC transporter permease FhuB [Cronobacter sakazakii]ELY5787831.1 Fe(3+)-hydroxamate ABC transporter permease FhuB [Cronobacter sakazakii]